MYKDNDVFIGSICIKYLFTSPKEEREKEGNKQEKKKRLMDVVYISKCVVVIINKRMLINIKA